MGDRQTDYPPFPLLIYLSKLEMESRKVGWQDPTLIYDEEKVPFCFRDDRFAFFYLIAYAAIVSLVRELLFPEVGE